jgi:ADP-ribose pyrophosphatase YjhB (NUDIX family)
MTTGEHGTATPAAPPLPIDEQIEQALWERPNEEGYREALARLTDADEFTALFGLARAVRRLLREEEQLDGEFERVKAQYDEAIDRRVQRRRWIERSLEASLRARRAAGLGNSIDFPTVGRWSTRSTSDGWDLPTRQDDLAALIRWFETSPDDYATVIERKPTVLSQALRTWLDDVRRLHPEDWRERIPPGVEYREAGVSVSYRVEGLGE